jgi:hypothetical protein
MPSGRKRWQASKRQLRVQARRRAVYRQFAATRTRRHGQLARRVLALGSRFPLESSPSSRAWQNGLDARSVAVLRGCLSHSCPAWLRVLAVRWSRCIPGGRHARSAATVARWSRNPCGSAGLPALVGSAPSGTAPAPTWPAFSTRRPHRAGGASGAFSLAMWGTPRAGGPPGHAHQPTRVDGCCCPPMGSLQG